MSRKRKRENSFDDDESQSSNKYKTIYEEQGDLPEFIKQIKEIILLSDDYIKSSKYIPFYVIGQRVYEKDNEKLDLLYNQQKIYNRENKHLIMNSKNKIKQIMKLKEKILGLKSESINFFNKYKENTEPEERLENLSKFNKIAEHYNHWTKRYNKIFSAWSILIIKMQNKINLIKRNRFTKQKVID